MLDSGKAIAAMLTNPGEVLDYLEVIGRGKTIPNPSAAFIAIPTTAGTGSEVTRNAVITSDDGNVKASLRSPFMLPRAAIVDPELTLGLPPEVTASTGMDALAQVLEPFVCKRANPMTDLYCREGLSRAATALQAAYRNGDNLEARCQMSWASLLGGLSLANAGLGAVHGFAAPLGGLYKAPHGALCAVLLAGVVRGNVQALRAREAQNPVLDRFLEIAKILTQNPAASIEDGITWLEALTKELHIPSLSKYGVVRKDFKLIIEKALQASSMKANPIALTEEELERILAESLDL